MFNVDISLFQNAYTIAVSAHVFRWIELQFNDAGTIDFFLDARRRIFAAHFASLIEHVGRDFANVGADENL